MADIKDKKAKINNGENIELEGVTVINSGISLAETKKEEPKEEVSPVVSGDVVIPEFAAATEVPVEQTIVPEVSPVDIPLAPVDLPLGVATTSELPVSPEFENTSLPSFEQKDSSAQVYTYQPTPASNTNFSASGVYKSANDVDLAEAAFLNDVKEAYDKNIVGPTKSVVALINDFVAWGNKVTTQGLNRALFEEFDELSARYDGMEIATYGDDKVADINAFRSSYGNDSNNFGGMAA